MIKKLSFILSLFIIFFSVVFSQDKNAVLIKKIKNSKEYIWEEGEAESKEKAKNIAEGELLSSIQVNINVKTYSNQRETNTEQGAKFVDDFQKKHSSFTGMYLKGLKKIFINRKKILNKDKWYVFIYIHEDKLKESFNLRKEKIRSYVLTGNKSEDKGEISEALRNYYWGYLLSLSYPDTIHFSSIDQKLPNNPKVATSNCINSLIDNIEIEADMCNKKGGQGITVPLNFQYEHKPVKDLAFSYYSGMGTDYGLVDNGYSEVTLYDQPASKTRKLTLKIKYIYEDEMAIDQEILNLYDIFKENKFNSLKNVSISFPWISKTSKDQFNTEVKMRTEAMDVLNNRRNIRNFLEVLVQYKKLGILNFGHQSDFGNGENCFVAVANNKQIVEILYFNGDYFINVNNNKKYSGLSDKFRGKRQIWIQETRKRK